MFSIIVVLSKNNCIGNDNKLLWHLPEDLKHFRNTTLNHKVLIGRKCFESLPKILDKREHFVVTKNENYYSENTNINICNDLDKFIQENKNTLEEIFVIGGGEIYKKLLPYAENLYLTFVDKEMEGDTFFPKVDFSMYNKTYESTKFYNDKEDVSFYFVNYKKK